jgi:pyridoxine 4-dehydrogenase
MPGPAAGAAAAAGTWPLGDLTVNRLGFGAMRLTGDRPFAAGLPSDREQSIAVLRQAVELGRDHLDVVNLRRMRQDSIADHFGALADLRAAGLIRHLGVSDVSVSQLDEAQSIAPVVCVQNRFSLDDQTHADVLAACRERGIAFVPFFAVAGDRRSAGGPGTPSTALEEVAERHGATPAQVRLAWTLHQGPNVLAIPGTGNRAHLDENVTAAALHLTADDLALLP